MTEQLVVLVPELGERGARERSAHDLAVTSQVRADGPALADGTLGDVIVKHRVEAASTPDLLVKDGLGEDEVLGHGASSRLGLLRANNSSSNASGTRRA